MSGLSCIGFNEVSGKFVRNKEWDLEVDAYRAILEVAEERARTPFEMNFVASITRRFEVEALEFKIISLSQKQLKVLEQILRQVW